MRLRIIFCLTLILLAVAGSGWSASWNGTCQIRFFAESTLHDFVGETTCEPFTWTRQDSTGQAAAAIQNAVIRVPVASMDTANSKRDKKMYRMFDVDNYPLIKGLFADFDPQLLLRQLRTKGDEPGQLTFQLRIRDVTRPVAASLSELQETPQRISFVAEFPVSLRDFQLKAPSVLGLIRVADNVRVAVNVVLQPAHGFNETQ